MRFAGGMFVVTIVLFLVGSFAGVIGPLAGWNWAVLTGAWAFGLAIATGLGGLVILGLAPVIRRQRKGGWTVAQLFVFVVLALVSAAPVGAWAAGYETRSGSTSTSTTDNVSGVPVPGGGTRSTSTSTSSSDSFSRSRPVYDGWERANMTAATAVNVLGAMQSIAGLVGGMAAGPVVATPTGVYAPNGNGGYYGGYGYGGGGQAPPFVYQRAVSAPPAPVCYPHGCYVWQQSGWQWVPAAYPASMPTVTVSVGQPVPASRQCTDGRGFYWLC